jgi:hypothetical protein
MPNRRHHPTDQSPTQTTRGLLQNYNLIINLKAAKALELIE